VLAAPSREVFIALVAGHPKEWLAKRIVRLAGMIGNNCL
jgi:hypothetical protein